MVEMNDLSLYPESYMIENALGDPLAFGNSKNEEIKSLVEIADLAVLPFEKVKTKIIKFLKTGSVWEKYWACMVCSQFGKEAKMISPMLKFLVKDNNLMVRMRAIEALALVTGEDPMRIN